MKTQMLCLFIVSAIPAALAQYSDPYMFSSDDTVVLNPFQVVSAGGGSTAFDPRNRGSGPPNTPITLTRRADSVLLSLTVSSEAKRPEDRIAQLDFAYQELKRKAEEDGRILFRSGFVALPLATRKLLSFTPRTSDEVASFDVTLIVKMGEEDSLFERTNALNSFIDGIELGREINVYFNSTSIGLLDPEAVRGELLQRIGAEAALMRETFGPGVALDIRGLDGRVQVRRLNDNTLELYLPYAMVVSTEPTSP